MFYGVERGNIRRYTGCWRGRLRIRTGRWFAERKLGRNEGGFLIVEQAFDVAVVVGDFVYDNNEVAVVPVDDAGERDAGQEVGEGGFDGYVAQADLTGGVADVEKGNAFAGDAAKVAEVLQGVVFPVIFGDDLEVRGIAVLGIHLKFIWKTL